MTEEAASQLERDHVHSVYDKIAPYFNDSRYKAWPKVRQFLLDLEPGSIVADIGERPLTLRLEEKKKKRKHLFFISKSPVLSHTLGRLWQWQVPSHQQGSVQAGL